MSLHNKYFILIVLNLSVITLQKLNVPSYSADILRLTKAGQINAYRNQEISPCIDFYGNACDKWKLIKPATFDKPRTSYLDTLQEAYQRKCVQLLSDSDDIDDWRLNDAKANKKLKDFYKSCRTTQDIDNVGYGWGKGKGKRHGNAVLSASGFWNGILPLNWPLTPKFENWDADNFDWLNAVATIKRLLGIDILIGLDIVPDFKDSSTQRITIGAPELELGSYNTYISSDFAVKRYHYRERIVNALLAHFTYKRRWAEEVANQVLDLEIKLARGIPDDFDYFNVPEENINVRSVAELGTIYGNHINLSRYLHKVFNRTIHLDVYETPKQYITNLAEVIRTTPPAVLANYTIWRIYDSLELDGDSDLVCIQEVIKHFPYQMEAMYFRHFEHAKTALEVGKTFVDLKDVFKDKLTNLAELQWLTPNTRYQATRRLSDMSLFITQNNDDDVNSWFRENINTLQISERRENFYENQLNAMKWHNKFYLQRYSENEKFGSGNKLTTDYEFEYLPKYNGATNEIEVPFVFLQDYFFWSDAYPIAIKYASIGYILAQEFIRGFLNIDSEEKQDLPPWWDFDTQRAFREQAKCFIDQRANMRNHNETIVELNEDIVMSGALDLSYRLFQNMLRKDLRHTSNHLPHINLSANQLYFLQFAQLWCEDIHDSEAQFTTEWPTALRINNALKNFAEFSSNFKCVGGDFMSSSDECQIF